MSVEVTQQSQGISNQIKASADCEQKVATGRSGGSHRLSQRLTYLPLDESIVEDPDLGSTQSNSSIKLTLNQDGPVVKDDREERASACYASRRELWSLDLQAHCASGPGPSQEMIFRAFAESSPLSLPSNPNANSVMTADINAPYESTKKE